MSLLNCQDVFIIIDKQDFEIAVFQNVFVLIHINLVVFFITIYYIPKEIKLLSA